MRRMLGKYGDAARSELARMLRFSIVGLSVAVVYAVGFVLLRHAGAVPWAASALSFAVAVFWQYVAQSRVTFGSRPSFDGQSLRFAFVIGAGFSVSTLINGWLGPTIGLSEAVTLAVVIIWLPVQNYILFRLWVFRGNHRNVRLKTVLR